jgi:parallel beta-helix repeat protein
MAIREVNPEWWGAVGDGVTDDTVAVQAAITSCANSGRTVILLGRTYRTTSTILIPAGVNIIGTDPYYCCIDYTGTGTTFLGSAGWHHQQFMNFKVTHENNTNTGVMFFDANKGASNCDFFHLRLIPNGIHSSTAIWIRGKDSLGSANSNCFFNNFYMVKTTAASGIAETDAPALSMGSDELNCRANANRIILCDFGKYSTGVYLEGGSNSVRDNNFQANSYAGVHIASQTAGTVRRNFLGPNWFEAFPGGSYAYRFTNNATGAIWFGTVFESYGCEDPANDILATENTGQVFYTWMGKSIILGGDADNTGQHTINAAQITNLKDDAWIGVLGGRTDGSGELRVCGKDSTASNLTSPGGVGVAISTDADARFRLCRSADNSAMTKLLSYWSDGTANFFEPNNQSYLTLATQEVEVTTFTAAATKTLANLIPEGAWVVGVVTRVTEAIVGPTSISIGTAGTPTLWGDSKPVILGSKTDPTDFVGTTMTLYLAATDVIITANGSNFTGGAGNGKLRAVVHYLSLGGPAS